VQKRGEAGDRRHHVRDDAERATERGDDARARAARQARGQRVDDTGTRRRDDD